MATPDSIIKQELLAFYLIEITNYINRNGYTRNRKINNFYNFALINAIRSCPFLQELQNMINDNSHDFNNFLNKTTIWTSDEKNMRHDNSIL